MFGSTSLRLAAVYTAVFALAVVVLGVITLATTRQALSREFDSRLRAEALALQREYVSEGLNGVLQAVKERDVTPGALDYGLTAASGRPLAGRLAGAKAPLTFSVLRIHQPGEPAEPVRVLASRLPGGETLLVGDDLQRVSVVDHVLLRGFTAAFLGVLLLGVAGGYALSRDVHRRLSAISQTAEAIIDGDLTRRVLLRGADDDLDRLAGTINRMLDRSQMLMESLRQVSSDIAHDLRTPLTRLRQRLEASLAAPDDPRSAGVIEAALGDLDAILDTFAALLRIAQIEGGAGRSALRPVDLSQVCASVAEAFAPSAEEAGRSLSLAAAEPALVEGDRDLLAQMLVNLLENAMAHTPRGSKVQIRSGSSDGAAWVAVIDDGPGIPATERTRVFDRFYRLERSRSTPGNGLGLALVAAVARLHEAKVELLDAHPGLEARVRFPAARS